MELHTSHQQPQSLPHINAMTLQDIIDAEHAAPTIAELPNLMLYTGCVSTLSYQPASIPSEWQHWPEEDDHNAYGPHQLAYLSNTDALFYSTSPHHSCMQQETLDAFFDANEAMIQSVTEATLDEWQEEQLLRNQAL